MMNQTRREFVKDSLAALGFMALPCGVLAAPDGWQPNKKPNLVFGILSDTHLMVEWDGKSLCRSMTLDYIRNAFKLFKARGIDVFVHLGDAAHRGAVREWEFHKEAFDRAFGKHGGPEKIIIVGNHELFGDCDRVKKLWPDPAKWRENAICADVARHYERVWGEPYSEFFHKEVKGYHFFGRHWGEGELKSAREKPFADYILSKAAECALKGAKPFFILSHRRHHFHFCKAMRGFPNAVAFLGHWHQSNADWKTIYYDRDTFGGFFPHIEVGACRYDGSNGLLSPDEMKMPEDSSSFAGSIPPSRQAMIVSLYDDMVVFERHEVNQCGKLGPDWVMPIEELKGESSNLKVEKKPHPFSKDELKKAVGEPQFGKNAKLEVKKASTALRVIIPMADGNPKSRVYAYNVVVVGDDPKSELRKSEYFSGVNSAVGREPDRGVTTVEIPKSQLPAGKKLTIAVRPVSSLGTEGKEIATTLRV